MTQEIVSKVKRRIDPVGEIWSEIEEQVLDIVDDVESQLMVRLGVDCVPDDLEYIVTAVSVKMYNRIGSEGTASHTVEGETMTWSGDPFEEYRDDIEAWRSRNSAGRTHICFI